MATTVPPPGDSAPSDYPEGTCLTRSLAAGDTASVEAWKSGGSWSLHLRDPSGAERFTVPWADPAVTTLAWTAEQDGEFTVECRPREASGAACELLIGPTPPSPEAVARQRQVEAGIREGYVLLTQWSRDARQRALAVFGSSLDMARTLDSPSHEVDALVGLARTHQLGGDLARPVPLLEEAAARAGAAADVRRLALVSARVGSSLAAIGDLEAAEGYIQTALNRAAAVGYGPAAAEAHLAQGDVFYVRGALADAGREFNLARRAFEDLGDRRGTIEATLNGGYVVADLGDDRRARDVFEQARRLAHEAGEKRLEALALRVLGNVCSKLSESYQAIRFLQAAQRLFEDSEDRVALVALYNALGEVHARLNDLEVAIQYHEKAEELARAVHRPAGRGSALIEIAKCQLLLERPEAAARTYDLARGVFESLGDRAMVASALDGVGSAHCAAGRFEVAFDHFQQALALMDTVGETRQSARVLTHLAETQLAVGRTSLARDAARAALGRSRKARDLEKEAQALFVLAQIDRREGALEQAREHVEQALAVDEVVRSRVPSQELRALFFSGVEPRFGFYVDLLMELERAGPAASYDRLAFEASERARARVLLDRLQTPSSTVEVSSEALIERERVLRDEVSRHALAADLEASEENPESQKRLRETLAELRRVRGLIGPVPANLPSSTSSTTLGLHEIRAKLTDDRTLLLEYFLGSERSYLWAVSKDLFSAHVLPSRGEIEAAAREVYQSVTARQRDPGGSALQRRARAEGGDARFFEVGESLARTILGPIEDLDDYERLVVVGDGLLHYLPFSALPHPQGTGEKGGYQPLLLTHEILRVPSLSAAVAMDRRSREARDIGEPGDAGVAVLADPVFTPDDPRVQGEHPDDADANGEAPLLLKALGRDLQTLPRLLASRREAFSIARTGAAGDVRVMTDFEASRSVAEATLRESHRVVHFATHGVLDDEHPELSGIVCTLVDESGRLQDGYLRAQDVYDLRVGADLVVLSGCETALGTMLRGEGITGLVRAFIHSGANTVVASTWRVDDLATEELMTEFYRGLLGEGLQPTTALRRAQMKLFRRRSSRAPFYWGAFEVHGLSGLGPAETLRRGAGERP